MLMIVGLMPGTAELREFELADDHLVGYAYVFGLSVVQLATSFLTVGLASRWGVELMNRRVPRLPVIMVATLGGLAVTWLFTVSMTTQILTGHRPDAGHTHGTALVLMVACYAPIVLWGPLELLATYGYWRRRRATVPAPQLHGQRRQVVSGG
ncbi:hypothetical protein GCM10007298_44900 [Williamsia phyllosphaerae]|uniref:Uncharacterized protein n=1 Tax=Williamsia phyllosphaerae TaxID=885042 RepID=A0ABQ1V8M0_9NOCA|nr:hypothetical protein GCM10007298_44900 [Williamsia phyllosphaerae]